MRLQIYKTCLFCFLLFIRSAYSQVTVHVNSGKPNFPFPQFLDYKNKHAVLKNLGTKNSPGVTHAEMELRIKEAYQIMFNRANYSTWGNYPDGTRYIKFKSVPECSEGDGYALLAAAYMGDKVTFDGLYGYVHDRRRLNVKRWSDNIFNDRGRKYGKLYGVYGTDAPGGAREDDSAADGDFDIVMALLIAWAQWGDNMGKLDAESNQISYKAEAISAINALVELDEGDNIGDTKFSSGNIGFDGYFKGGNTWAEMTNWGATLNPGPQFLGVTTQYIDYNSPAWFNEMRRFLKQVGNQPSWSINQFKRGEASADWLMGHLYNKANTTIPMAGNVIPSNAQETEFTITDDGKQAEDIRHPWRHLLNYVWHGNPDSTWNPVTHQAEPGSNTFEKDMGLRFSKFLANPQGSPWNNPCESATSSVEKYWGPPVLYTDYEALTGKVRKEFFQNWILGGSSPAPIIGQDFDLMGQMYRQCEIEWNVETAGDNYLTSVPVYFHGWFRLLGMLVLSGNYHAPMNMTPSSNLKIYRSVDKTFGFTNDQFTFKIDYRNYGSVSAANVKIEENIPVGFEFVSATGKPFTRIGDKIVFNVGSIDGVSSEDLTLTQGSVSVTMRALNSASGRYCFSANIFEGSTLHSTTNEYPNNVTEQMERNCIDIIKRSLKIQKTSNRPIVNPSTNGDIIYKIKFENSSEAGWLNGGRPGVNVAYAHGPTVSPSHEQTLKFRLFHDAHEAYINYGNYRISYFANNPAINCVAGTQGCPTGWSMENGIYEGGAKGSGKLLVEKMKAGSDARGSWNQRLVLQFSNQLVTTTPHLFHYFGMGQRIHRGGTEPLRGTWRLFTSNNAQTDWNTDWSWDPDATAPDGSLYFPVTNSWQDPDQPNTPIKTWHNHMCDLPTHKVDNVLVEEYDGYVWRRILGSGPAPGRDIENVTVSDTLPLGVTIKNFIRQNPFGIDATTKIEGGRTIISWSIPRMLVNEGDSIVYIAKINSACPGADKQLINTAWIGAGTESKVSEADTITVTCNPVSVCPLKTSLDKTSDKTKYQLQDKVIYSLKYTQTQGSIATPNLSSALDWKVQSGAGGTFGTNKLVLDNGSNVVITHDYSYGRNTLQEGITGTIEILNNEGQGGLVVRHSGGDVANGVYIIFKRESAFTLVDIYDGKNKIQGGSFNIPISSAFYDFKIHLDEDKLSFWLVASGNTLSDMPNFTLAGLPKREGYAGAVHGSIFSSNNPYSSFTVHNWKTHLDAAFNVQITDSIPKGIINPTAIAPIATTAGSAITWTLAAGKTPLAYDSTANLSWTGTYNNCAKITNIAYVNTLGIPNNQYGVCYDINCGTVTCNAPTTLTLPVNTLLEAGKSTLLTATPTPASPGFTFNWYKLPNTTTPLLGSGLNKTSFSVTDTGRYIVRAISPTDITCFKESGVAIVSYLCEQPVISLYQDGSLLTAPYDIKLCPGQTTKLAFAPQKYAFEYDIRAEIGAPLMNELPVAAGDSAKFTLTEANEGSYLLNIFSDPGNLGKKFCWTKADSLANPIKITVSGPAFNINRLTSDTNLCAGDELTLFNQQNVNATWIDPNGIVTEGVSYTNRSPVKGIYKAVYAIGTCTTKDSVTVNITNLPVAVISPANPTYCPSGNGTTLTASRLSGAEYSWTKDNDPPSPFVGSSTLSGALVGSYKVTVKVNNCSTTSAPVVVTISSNLSLNIDGDTTLCPGGGLNLTTDQASGIAWTLPDKSTQENPKLVLDNPADGYYTAVYTGPGGCTGRDSVLVSHTTNPIASITPSAMAYCKSEKGVKLTATGGSAGATYSWYLGTVKKTDTTSNEYPGAIAGDWKVVITSAEGCFGESLPVSITQKLSPIADIATKNASYCPGESGVLLSATDAGTGASFEWFKNTLPAGSALQTLPNATTGNSYTVKVTLDGCDSTSLPVTVTTSSNPSLSITGDTSICTGDTLNLNTDKQSGIIWTLPDLSKVSFANLELKEPAPGKYIAEYSSQGTCTGYDTVTVLVNSKPVAEVMPDKYQYCPGQNGLTLTARNDGPSLTFQWFKDNNPVSVNSSANFISLQNATAGSYFVKVNSGECSDSSQPVTVSESLKPDVSITTTETSYCQGSDGLTLSATTTATDPIFQWMKDGIEFGTPSSTSELLKATAGVYSVKVTSGACEGISAPVNIEEVTSLIPKLELIASTIDTCVNSLVTVKASGTAGSIEWFEDGTSKGISVDYSDTLIQTTKIRAVLTTTLSCASPKTAEKEIEIKASQRETPEVTIERQPASVKNCEGEATTFTSTATSAGNSPDYVWIINGKPNTQETSDTLLLQNWTNNTTVELEMTRQDGCVAAGKNKVISNLISLTGNPSSRTGLKITGITDNTRNGFICPGQNVTLTVTTNLQDPNMTYSWRNKTQLTSSTATFDHIITEDITDTITVSVSACIIGDTTATLTRLIKVETPISVQITNNLGGNFTKGICAGDTTEFTRTSTGNISVFKWFVNDRSWPEQGTGVEIYNLKDNDQVKVVAEASSSCSTTASDSTIIKVDIKPDTGFINGEREPHLCLGDDITVSAKDKNPAYLYSWTKDSSDLNKTTDSLNITDGGLYKMKITNGACEVFTPVTVTKSNLSVKILADRTEFVPGEQVHLKSDIVGDNGRLIYSWTPADIMTGPADRNTISTPANTVFVKIKIEDSFGCFAIDSLELKKKDPLFIPNALSPNTNDQNAVWGITGAENYLQMEIKVFNRWGSLVHQQTGYSTPWDGTLNGKNLPAGTYYYVIKDRAFEKPLVGDLTIIR